MTWNLKTAAWLLVLGLTGCASGLPRALDDVRTGMDKDQVLEMAGNPKQTFRENSEDHWLYQYFSDDKEWKRDVIFEAGKVTRISRPLAKENWVRDLENAKSMDEFEQKARAHQKKADAFKPVGDDGKDGQ